MKILDEDIAAQTKFSKLENQDNAFLKDQKQQMMKTCEQNLAQISRLENQKKRNRKMREAVFKNVAALAEDSQKQTHKINEEARQST